MLIILCFILFSLFFNSGRIRHWNANVVILMTFSSLVALEVVILTTSGAASDGDFLNMTTFPIKWWNSLECDEIHLSNLRVYGYGIWNYNKKCLFLVKACDLFAHVRQVFFTDTRAIVILPPWWRHLMEKISALLAPLCGEFTGNRWISHTRASDAELWYFLWSAPE